MQLLTKYSSLSPKLVTVFQTFIELFAGTNIFNAAKKGFYYLLFLYKRRYIKRLNPFSEHIEDNELKPLLFNMIEFFTEIS
jgi:hypothetical protein